MKTWYTSEANAARILLACTVLFLATPKPARSAPKRIDAAQLLDVQAPEYGKLRPSEKIWAGSTFWTGPDWTRVGKDWHHPGINTPSIRCFTAPKDGKITISGRIWKFDTNGGDGVRVWIQHDEQKLWEKEINAKDKTGFEPKLTLDVRRGDAIRFVVHKRGRITCDTTHWDPLITYADGTRFQASAGFSTKRIESVWSYEMAGSGDFLQVKIDQGGFDILQSVLASETVRQLQSGSPKIQPDFKLWLMVQIEWLREDKIDDKTASYQKAIDRHLQLSRPLLADLQKTGTPGFLQAEARQLASWTAEWEKKKKDKAEKEVDADLLSLYYRVRWLKRHIALSNPLMCFGKMLFTKRVPPAYSHLVMQYYGWRARPGGGIFILENPGHSLECRDILDGKLDTGSVLEPRLSYDAKRIVFSFVDNADKTYSAGKIGNNDKDEGFYHIFEVGVDGRGFRQLTSGSYDDLMPTYLPDGGIAFCSTRRRGYARCFGGAFSNRWHVYTLHRLDADGKNLKTLSFHDTNEWFPVVGHDGRLLYSRWDYIDRDAVTHQNLWATRPDGTNPVAVWGNAAPSPHCTFQPQPIPNSRKIVFTASAHHSITAGSIVVLDPSVHDNSQTALQRITPEIPFPEAESRRILEYYSSPWPLSETYFLTAYSPLPLVWEPSPNVPNALGIYLLDAFGNRELIYRDLEIGSTNPCPLRPRKSPPAIPSFLPKNPPPTGEVILSDIYQGLGNVPRGTIKQLRIVQIFPKTTPYANRPPIGVAREENGRAILGTVPVESDGSARFIVPAKTPILFQALDEDGLAYQTMRTLTYLQPGETVSCVGCHENRMDSPPPRTYRNIQAMHRAASEPEPGPFDNEPFSYVRVVQPILDRHCIKCHAGEKPAAKMDLTGTRNGAFTRSYRALGDDTKSYCGDDGNAKQAARARVPRFRARNQIQITQPGGGIGARGSTLIKQLRAGHHKVKLTAEELRLLGTWIDMNAIFYGVNDPESQAKLLQGEKLPMQKLR